jgi:hypothetical protein
METITLICGSYVFNTLFPDKFTNIKRILNNNSLLTTSYYLLLTSRLTQSIHENMWLVGTSSMISYICSYTGYHTGLAPVLFAIKCYNQIVRQPIKQCPIFKISYITNILNMSVSLYNINTSVMTKHNIYYNLLKTFITEQIISYTIGATVAVGIHTVRHYIGSYIKPCQITI